MASCNIAETKISYGEYKRIRRTVNCKMEIPHDKPVYFEDDEKACYTEISDLSKDHIFTRVETDASYRGGWKEWQTFLWNNVDKKLLLLFTNSLGLFKDSVTVKYVVRKEGGISNLVLIQWNNTHLADEAIRLLKLSCLYWVPAETAKWLMPGRNKSFCLK